MTEIFEIDLRGNAGCTIAEIPKVSYQSEVTSKHGLVFLEDRLSVKVKRQ